MNTRYVLLGSESKKAVNKKQAQIIILKAKLKLETDKNSLVQKKLGQEVNKNARGGMFVTTASQTNQSFRSVGTNTMTSSTTSGKSGNQFFIPIFFFQIEF